MHVHLIHNPRAGDEEHSRDVLLRTIRKFGHEVHYLDAHSSWEEQVHAAAPSDLVAVAGGDGTVAKVGRVLSGSDLPIAVLPLGTANNISGMLGVADTPIEMLIEGWARATRRRVDVGVARGPWGTFRFLESVGVGAFADSIAEVAHGAAQHVDQLDDAEARIQAALELISNTVRHAPSRSLEVVLDGQDLSGEFILVEALNFGTAGPNLRLAHASNPDDGLLDLVTVGEADRRTLADHLPLYRIDPGRAPALPVQRGAHLLLACEHQVVHLDDRLWCAQRQLRIEITVDPGALVFLV